MLWIGLLRNTCYRPACHRRPALHPSLRSASSALRLGNDKLIKFYFPTVHYERYNLQADPSEHQNLFHPKDPDCQQLSQLLNSKLLELGALKPIKGK